MDMSVESPRLVYLLGLQAWSQASCLLGLRIPWSERDLWGENLALPEVSSCLGPRDCWEHLSSKTVMDGTPEKPSIHCDTALRKVDPAYRVWKLPEP